VEALAASQLKRREPEHLDRETTAEQIRLTYLHFVALAAVGQAVPVLMQTEPAETADQEHLSLATSTQAAAAAVPERPQQLVRAVAELAVLAQPLQRQTGPALVPLHRPEAAAVVLHRC
jgi:hypothetical protein